MAPSLPRPRPPPRCAPAARRAQPPPRRAPAHRRAPRCLRRRPAPPPPAERPCRPRRPLRDRAHCRSCRRRRARLPRRRPHPPRPPRRAPRPPRRPPPRSPTDGRRAYDDAIARLAVDPAGATARLAACAAAITLPADAAWCTAGLGRLALAAGHASDALAASARPPTPTLATPTSPPSKPAPSPPPAPTPRPRLNQPARHRLARPRRRPARPRPRRARRRRHRRRPRCRRRGRPPRPDAAAPHALAAAIEAPRRRRTRCRLAPRRRRRARRPRPPRRARPPPPRARPPRRRRRTPRAPRRARPCRPCPARALADALLAAGATERARAWADVALRLAPDDPEALTLAARAAVAAGQIEAAYALLARVTDPAARLDAGLALAAALARAGHPPRAESEYAALVVRRPDAPAAWRAYAAFLTERGELDRAEKLLRQAVMRHPEAPTLHTLLAEVFERQGNRAGARLALGVAARLEPLDPAHEDELARVEFLDGASAEAVARWEALVDRHPDADRARRRLSAALRALDEPAKAAALLRVLVDRHPDDPALKADLGETLLAAGNKHGAVAPLQEALAAGADADRLRPLLATALADTGRPADAERLFEEALAADPGNRPLRLTYAAFREAAGDDAGAVELYRAQLARNPHDFQVIARLQALVGDEQITDLVRGAIYRAARVAPDLALLARRATAPFGDAQGSVLRDERRVVVDADGVAEIHHRRSILIQRPGGAELYREIRLPYHAETPPTVVVARTLTPDGEIVDVPATGRELVNPQAGTPLYGDGRQLVLRFDALEPGAIVDYEVVTHRPHPDLPGAWWDGYVLGNADPTVRARYTLELPADAPLRIHAPAMPAPDDTTEGPTRRLIWERHDLPAYRDEGAGEIPAVHVTGFTDWAAVDRWYHALFAPRTHAGPAVARRAAELVADRADRRARIAAIYRFVEANVRYLGVEFGIGAFQPRPPESTLAQGLGDCKDVTALMVALLAEAGVPAWPALIRPRGHGPFDPEQPSPGQFSHVILYVPDPKGDLWLDATAGLGTLDAIPHALRGRRALVVDGDGGRLIEVPVGDGRHNRLVEERTFELTPTGGGRLTAELSLTGDLAGHGRRAIAELDASARRALLSAPGLLLGDGRIPDEVDAFALDDPQAPLELRASLTHDDLVAVRLDGALVIPFDLGVFTDGPLADLGGDEARGTPRVYERRLRIIPPRGYRLAWEPLDFQTDGPIALAIDERRARGEVVITARMQIEGGDLDARERETLAESARAAQAQMERDLVMLPGPDFDRVGFLEAIVTERPDEPRLKLYLAQALLERDRALDAATVLIDAAEQAPDDPEIGALLALVRTRLGSIEQIEDALRATTERPDAPAASYLAYAALLAESGRHADALAVIARGQARHPDDIELNKAELGVLGRAGRRTEALARARDLARARADDPDVQALLGEAAAAAGEAAEAEAAWRRALALAPTDARALNNLAWLLRDRPEARDEAIRLARRAVEAAPGNGSAWDTLAELLYRAGDIDGALSANERAASRDPEHRALYETRRRKYELRRARGPGDL
ncbi:MAG: tetratricopeptide repeat protein [Myxococcales bacterium]|nr:tetratricopeptide repeat protein [Myxococcales bacterium]